MNNKMLKCKGIIPNIVASFYTIFGKTAELYSIIIKRKERRWVCLIGIGILSLGNATQISLHDPETGEWIFNSKNV